MKTYLFIFLSNLSICLKAQFGCSPTATAGEFFPPNSINNSVNPILVQYLCGPNTVLYDTTIAYCHQVYVENNCSLIFRPNCSSVDQIWLKNNSVLTILNGLGVVYIHFELGAIINQPLNPQYSFAYDTCSSITYPTMNCVTGIKENTTKNISLLPNPTNGLLTINSKYEIQKIELISITGQLLLSESVNQTSHQLQLQNFAEGIYFVKVVYVNGMSVTKKVVKQ